MQDQLIRMKAARIRLVRNKVFFGAIAMRLELVEDSGLPTIAATDGRRVLFNPEQLQPVAGDQLEGLLAHEALHVMLLHHIRRGSRDAHKWNQAADYAINQLLIDEGFKLPDGGLIDAKYRSMSAEEIYELLPDSQGQTGFDTIIDTSSDMSEKERQAEESRIKAEVVNAAALARKAGSMTKGIEHLIEAICEPKANWQAQLLEFVTQSALNDFDWARPSQRHMQQYGVFCPTLDSRDHLGAIGLINDTSGSTARYQEQFASELSEILSQFDCTITVINHDTEVKSVEEYSSDDLPIQLKVVGYGGTVFAPAYKYAEENFDFDVIVALTDGEASWRDVEAPSCPVLVACCNRDEVENVPGWARTIDIS